jgi:hypothetical protein
LAGAGAGRAGGRKLYKLKGESVENYIKRFGFDGLDFRAEVHDGKAGKAGVLEQ